MGYYFIRAKTKREAKQRCSGATYVKCDGGYLCFETITDYDVWKNSR
jgi:hypothetical protein